MTSNNQQGVKRKADADIEGSKPEKKQEVESKEEQPSLQQLEDDARREYEAIKANPESTKKNDGGTLAAAHVKYLLACHKNGKHAHGPTWTFDQLTSKLLTAKEANAEVDWLYYITSLVRQRVSTLKTTVLVSLNTAENNERLLLLPSLKAEQAVIEAYGDCVIARMEWILADQLDIPSKEAYARNDYQHNLITAVVHAFAYQRHLRDDLKHSAMSVANGFSAECLTGCECKGLKKKSKDETLCFECLGERYYYSAPFQAMTGLREHSGLSYRQKIKLITDPICKSCYKRDLFCCQGDCKLADECEECARD